MNNYAESVIILKSYNHDNNKSVTSQIDNFSNLKKISKTGINMEAAVNQNGACCSCNCIVKGNNVNNEIKVNNNGGSEGGFFSWLSSVKNALSDIWDYCCGKCYNEDGNMNIDNQTAMNLNNSQPTNELGK